MDGNVKKILDIIKNSNLATGVDTSRYNISVDWDAAEYTQTLDIVDYAMIRVSSGVSDGTVYIDPLLEEQYTELEQHPHVVRDGYHYLSSHSKWTKQYDKFLEGIDGKTFDILTLDCEKIYNVRSREFAGFAYSFLVQLKTDFPDKQVKIYSNKYDYQDWFQYYYDFDKFPYHHAQYPWSRWNVENYLIDRLFQSLTNIFTGKTKPNLPASRGADGYELWQIGANTGIGHELGYGADYLDVNVSRRSLEDFREWSGLYKRWNSGEIIEPQPLPPAIEQPIGSVKMSGNLTIRDAPHGSSKNEYALNGNTYEVYQISTDNWYKLNNGWISGNTQWTSFAPYEPSQPPAAPITVEERLDDHEKRLKIIEEKLEL